MERKIAALRKHHIICGYGRVGSQIAEEIAAARKAFVVIDEHEANIQHCMHKGYLALQGNASRDSVPCAAGMHYAQVLFVATDQDANNLSITLSARHLNPGLFLIARANEDEAGGSRPRPLSVLHWWTQHGKSSATAHRYGFF